MGLGEGLAVVGTSRLGQLKAHLPTSLTSHSPLLWNPSKDTPVTHAALPVTLLPPPYILSPTPKASLCRVTTL